MTIEGKQLRKGSAAAYATFNYPMARVPRFNGMKLFDITVRQLHSLPFFRNNISGY
jgi:hypothetical protein